jgi:hypothetical protein
MSTEPSATAWSITSAGNTRQTGPHWVRCVASLWTYGIGSRGHGASHFHLSMQEAFAWLCAAACSGVLTAMFTILNSRQGLLGWGPDRVHCVTLSCWCTCKRPLTQSAELLRLLLVTMCGVLQQFKMPLCPLRPDTAQQALHLVGQGAATSATACFKRLAGQVTGCYELQAGYGCVVTMRDVRKTAAAHLFTTHATVQYSPAALGAWQACYHACLSELGR